MKLLKKDRKSFLLLCGLFMIAHLQSVDVFAQAVELKLAAQYFSEGEKEKALSVYRELAKKFPVDELVIEAYVKILIQQGLDEEARSALSKSIKKGNQSVKLVVYDYVINKKLLSEPQFEKYKKKFYDKYVSNEEYVLQIHDVMKAEGKLTDAVDLLLYTRNITKTSGLFAAELAQLYAILSKTDLMIKEYLFLLETYQMSKEEVQNFIQGELNSDSAYDIVENIILDRLQQNPQFIGFSEIMLWLYIQKRDFNKALVYAKSIDLRLKKKGYGLLELALLAYNNNHWEATKEICKETIQLYSSGNTYFQCNRLLLSVSEKVLKDKYPVDRAEVMSLIQEFERYRRAAMEFVPTHDVSLSIARLYAFYLQKFDTAIFILESITLDTRVPHSLQAEAKLELGDIYLITKRPWEASLTYSQVEKSMKDQPLGYEAKYRNARLNYFKGEFLLAQSHLDILKLATTREIANNAIQLSLLIKDNLEADSTEEALQLYAAAEQLEFINKLEEAVDMLKKLSVDFSNHPLMDEVYYKEAVLLRKLGRSYEALAVLDALLTKDPEAILADDALFLKANIQEVDLRKPKEAMETYFKFLSEYQGSTLVNEVRKKYRQLRGDKIN